MTTIEHLEPWRIDDRAVHRVFNAWYASLISGCAALLLTAWDARAGIAAAPNQVAISLDGLLTIGLGFLTYRYRSRAAAALLVVRSIGFGAALLMSGGVLFGALALGVFAPIYLLGFLGTRHLARARRLAADRAPGT